MHINQKRVTRFGRSAVLAGMLVLIAIVGSGMPAFAMGPTITLTTNSGSIVGTTDAAVTFTSSNVTNGTPATINLAGKDQLVQFNFGITLTDSTGGTTGWSITADSTNPSTGTGTNQLATNTGVLNDDIYTTTPTNVVEYPVTLTSLDSVLSVCDTVNGSQGGATSDCSPSIANVESATNALTPPFVLTSGSVAPTKVISSGTTFGTSGTGWHL